MKGRERRRGIEERAKGKGGRNQIRVEKGRREEEKGE